MHIFDAFWAFKFQIGSKKGKSALNYQLKGLIWNFNLIYLSNLKEQTSYLA